MSGLQIAAVVVGAWLGLDALLVAWWMWLHRGHQERDR